MSEGCLACPQDQCFRGGIGLDVMLYDLMQYYTPSYCVITCSAALGWIFLFSGYHRKTGLGGTSEGHLVSQTPCSRQAHPCLNHPSQMLFTGILCCAPMSENNETHFFGLG